MILGDREQEEDFFLSDALKMDAERGRRGIL